MTVGRLAGMMTTLAAMMVASSALAIDPSIKCQSDKLRLAAKYTACRLNAEAQAARDFAAPDFTKCTNKYRAGWEKAEARALSKGAPCWTSGDAEAVQGDIDAHTGGLAESLGYGAD